MNLTGHIIDADFIPVKIGDVSFDWNYINNSISSIDKEELIQDLISIKETIKKHQNKISISFELNEPSSINGLQFQFNIQNSKLLDIESELNGFDEDNYNVTDDGMLMISWINVNNNEKVQSNLFTLNFDEKYQENIIQEVISSEIYINNETHSVKSETSAQNIISSSISDLTINPNPVNNETIISFFQETQSSVDFCIINLEGKVVFNDILKTKEGLNSFLFPSSFSYRSSGLFIVRLTNSENSITKKIIIAN